MDNDLVGDCSMCYQPLTVTDLGAVGCDHCDTGCHERKPCPLCATSKHYEGIGK